MVSKVQAKSSVNFATSANNEGGSQVYTIDCETSCDDRIEHFKKAINDGVCNLVSSTQSSTEKVLKTLCDDGTFAGMDGLSTYPTVLKANKDITDGDLDINCLIKFAADYCPSPDHTPDLKILGIVIAVFFLVCGGAIAYDCVRRREPEANNPAPAPRQPPIQPPEVKIVQLSHFKRSRDPIVQAIKEKYRPQQLDQSLLDEYMRPQV